MSLKNTRRRQLNIKLLSIITPNDKSAENSVKFTYKQKIKQTNFIIYLLRMSQKTLLMLLLVVSATYAQDLDFILTSDSGLQFYVQEETRETITTTSPDFQTSNLKTIPDIGGPVEGGIFTTSPLIPSTISSMRAPMFTAMPVQQTKYAKFGEPTQQALSQKADTFSLGPMSLKQNKQASEDLKSARWVYADRGNLVTFMTPCFHNPCPKGEYTLYFSSTCKFTILLVDKNGSTVANIGSGYAYASYVFKFFAPCGKYSLKIILNCTCPCAYVRFNLYQNRKGCFNCPSQITHNYNPNTCKCECVSKCNCLRPQTWYDYPTCGCGCATLASCVDGKIYNKRTCRCQCLPKCCPRYLVWNAAACRCEFESIAFNNTIIQDKKD